MSFIGHVDYIIDKDDENGLYVCVTVIKHLEPDDGNDVKRQFQIRFYDIIRKNLLVVPCDREVLRFLYSKKSLIENAIHFWNNKKALVVDEQDLETRTCARHVSLQRECKRTLLFEAPQDQFIQDKYFCILPRIMRYYLITWQDEGIGYLPTAVDNRPMGVDRDRDEHF
jgi:hypothetical protein